MLLSDSRLVRQVLNRGEGPDALWLGLLCLRRKGIGSEIQINTFLPRALDPHVHDRAGRRAAGCRLGERAQEDHTTSHGEHGTPACSAHWLGS